MLRVEGEPNVLPMSLIELDGVEKRYGELRALHDLTLTLEPGRIALLGPNGAGKSTLLKVLLGWLEPDHGSVRVLGFDVVRHPFEVRARIGYMPEGDAVLPELTALQFTILAGQLCGLPRSDAIGRAHQVLHDVGLGEVRYRKLRELSTGLRQRARLAQALVGDPRLLLLDEPTSGLDPQGREEMLALISDIPRRTGASVILSTHILADAEKTCDQVIVLAAGEVLYAGSLEPLIAPEEGVFEVRGRGDPEALKAALEAGGCEVAREGTSLAVRPPKGEGPRKILALALGAGQQVRHLAPLTKTLERAFLQTLEKAGHRTTLGAAGPSSTLGRPSV